MTATDAESVVRRWWEELWNQGNLSVVEQIIAPGYTNLDPATPGIPQGVEGARQLVSGYRSVFPDIHFSIQEQVVANNNVTCVWRCRGTQQGELMGIAPTGRTMEVLGISLLRLENGKIAQQTTVWDALGLLQQLGVVPSLAQPTG